MSRELETVRRNRNALDTRDEQESNLAPWAQPGSWSSFITFRYSSTEIYSQDGDIHVRTRQTRYQDGKLTSEECEGLLDRRAYERVVSETQAYFLNQVGSLVKLLFSPLYSQSSRSRRYDE